MLIISFVEWTGAFQRPQHMALGFARRGWDVTYVSPGYVHRRAQQVESGLVLPENLKILSPAALPGARLIDVVGKLNAAWLSHAVKYEMQRPWDAIIFNDARWSGVARELPAKLRVWDCMDDLSAHAPSARWMEEREREALSVAKRVWTGTASLADRLASSTPRVRFVPCGVEGQRFAKPDSGEVETARAEIDRLFDAFGSKPDPASRLAGYFGVINERFQMPLVDAIAEAGWRVLLIGPTSSQTPTISTSGHIRLAGPRPYTSLAAYLACMDLALIPYDIEGPHRFLYPVKALEYLAGGKPVLSTPLPDVERFLKDFVLLRSSPEEWGAVAREWNSVRPDAEARAAKGQSYALARDWDAMVAEMSEDLNRP